MTMPYLPQLPVVRKAVRDYWRDPIAQGADMAGLSRGTGDAVRDFAMGATEPMSIAGRAGSGLASVVAQRLRDSNVTDRIAERVRQLQRTPLAMQVAKLLERDLPREAYENARKLRASTKSSAPPSQRVTDQMNAERLTPDEVAANVQRAVERLQRPVSTDAPAPHGIIDRSMITPDAGPTTAALPTRRPFGDRQAQAHVAMNADPLNLELVVAQVLRGQQMKPPTFYSSYKAVDHAIGEAGGDPTLFRKATSAGAIQNPVDKEIVTGSLMQWALRNGIVSAEEIADVQRQGGKQAVEGLQALTKRIRNEAARQQPGAQGFMLMGGHLDAFGKMLRDEPLGAYKIPTYDAQKVGDVPGYVLDTHESKGGTLANPFTRKFSGQGGFASDGEYGFQETLYRDLAERMGVSDRTFQEQRWAGGGSITGLRSDPMSDYAQIFEDLLAENARARNLDPRALLKGVAQGRDFLFTPRR